MELSEIHIKSVNTMRIVTVIDDFGNVRIAKALFRIGNGKSVDNFCSGGVGAIIDIDTGIIFLPAIDENGNSYICHPISNKQIVGFKIPYWKDYINFAYSLASKCKQMRYVGWDIVRKDDGIMCCIEGNYAAGPCLQEVLTNYGLIPYYNALIHGNKEFDYKKYGGSNKY